MTTALIEKLAYHTWIELDDDTRRVIAEEVASGIDFRFTRTVGDDGAIAVLAHEPSGVEFALVPGGRFEMGFTERDCAALDRLAGQVDRRDAEPLREFLQSSEGRPAHEVDVAPFLIATEPLDDEALVALLDREGGVSLERCIRPSHFPIALKKLAARGWRLPSEAEWEYACRAGTEGLFPGGVDALPEEAIWPANGFGIGWLGELPEPCLDGWHSTYDGAPDDARPWGSGEPEVVRGGAATLHPWQGTGWLLAACAMRYALRDVEFFIALRPVRQIFDDELAYGEDARVERAAAGVVRRAPPRDASPPAEPPRAEANDALVLRTMSGKVAADLNEFLDLDDEAEAIEWLKKARSKALEDGFSAGADRAMVPDALPLLWQQGIPARHELGLLLLDRVCAGDHERLLPTFEWRRATATLSVLMLAFGSFAEQLEALFDDPDYRVRALVPLIIAGPLQSSWAAARLSARLRAEQHPAVRASIAVGLGVNGLAVNPHDRKIQLLESLLEDEHAIVRWAGAWALALGRGTDVRDEEIEALSTLFGHRIDDDLWFPWAHGDLSQMTAMLLRRAGERGAAHLTELCLRRIAALSGAKARADRREASWCANTVLELNFDWTKDPIEPSTLTESQREIVEALTVDGAPDADFDFSGMPLEVEARAAWLRGD